MFSTVLHISNIPPQVDSIIHYGATSSKVFGLMQAHTHQEHAKQEKEHTYVLRFIYYPKTRATYALLWGR